MKTKTFSLFWNPLDESRFQKILIVTGHLFFLIMALFSLLYYQERMLHFDTANYAFNLMYSGEFYYREGREVTILTQLLPLLALKAGASLKTILQVYSLSFVLFYYLIFNIIVYGFKNAVGGIFLILAMVLSLRYKFYAPVGEVVIGISTVGLLAGWITKEKEKFKSLPPWGDFLIGGVLIFFISMTHPFVYLSTFVLLGFVMIFFNRWKDISYWGIILFALAGMVIKYLQISKDGYESNRAAPLNDSAEILSGFSDLYVWEVITWYADTEYAFPLAVFAFVLLLMMWKKKWLSAIYLIITFSAMAAIVLVTYSYLDTRVYLMIDGYLAHIGLIWALPLSFYLLRSRRPVWIFLICLLMIFSLDRIRNKRKFFQQRQAYFVELLDKHVTEDKRKFLAHMRDFSWEKLWMPWPVALETLMMSSLEGPENAATIYIQWWEKDYDLEDPELFLGTNYDPMYFKSDKLPKHLFELKEGTYQPIRLPQ